MVKLQLGYECFTQGCPQSRVIDQLLFDQVAKKIEACFGVLDRRHYHQYLVGLRSYMKCTAKKAKSERQRLSKRLQKLETEKADVIEKRLTAIKAYEFDDDTKKWCSKRTKELNSEISIIKQEVRNLSHDQQSEVRTFKQIIELKENLHKLWLVADHAQKQAICEKLVLNLQINGTEIRSITWSKPIANWPKLPEFQSGGGNRQRLESYFAQLWSQQAQLTDFDIKAMLSLMDILETVGDRNKLKTTSI